VDANPRDEELEPAAGAPDRVNRHAGAGQRLDVTHHGPLRDLQALGELGRRGAATLLEDQHEVQEPPGTHREQSGAVANT